MESLDHLVIGLVKALGTRASERMQTVAAGKERKAMRDYLNSQPGREMMAACLDEMQEEEAQLIAFAKRQAEVAIHEEAQEDMHGLCGGISSSGSQGT